MNTDCTKQFPVLSLSEPEIHYVQFPSSDDSSCEKIPFKWPKEGEAIHFKIQNEQLKKCLPAVAYGYIFAQKRALIKEELFIKAINNLLKKNEYYELCLQLAEDVISESEFDEEINSNPSKYFIEVNDDITEEKFMQIMEITKMLPQTLTFDRISDIFSVSPKLLSNKLESLR